MNLTTIDVNILIDKLSLIRSSLEPKIAETITMIQESKNYLKSATIDGTKLIIEFSKDVTGKILTKLNNSSLEIILSQKVIDIITKTEQAITTTNQAVSKGYTVLRDTLESNEAKAVRTAAKDLGVAVERFGSSLLRAKL